MANWFDLEKFKMPAVRNTLYLLDEVTSTNDFLLGKIESAEATVCNFIGHRWHKSTEVVSPKDILKNSIAIAKTQTSGRGRQGRIWFDGGLQMSWDISAQVVKSGLSVWVGVICVEAIKSLTGKSVMMKWPNDIFLDGKKLGGILLDRVCGQEGAKLVSGVGVNLGDDLPRDLIASKLSSLTLEQLAGEIIETHDQGLDSFLTDGWSVWAEKFHNVDFLLDKRVVVDAKISGKASGIAESGALIIETEDGKLVESFASEAHITEVK